MRILLFLLAVVPLSAMAIDIYLEREREAREEAFIALAERIVGDELGAPKRQRLVGAVVAAPEDNDGQWGLRGKLFLADASGEKAHRRISANFDQTCRAIGRPGCWRLASLTVDGELVRPVPGSETETETTAAAPAPEETPMPEPAAPAAVETAAATEPPAAEETVEPETAAPPQEAEPAALEETPRPARAEEEPEAAEEFALAGSDAAQEAVQEAPVDVQPAPQGGPGEQRAAATIDLTRTRVEAPATPSPEAAAASAPEAEAQAEATAAKTETPAGSASADPQALPELEVQAIALTAAVQAALNELGYNPSVALKIDGKMGPRTRATIRDYQRDHGLALEGRPTRALLSHMREQLRQRGESRSTAAASGPAVPEVPEAPQPAAEPLPSIATTSQALPAAPEAPQPGTAEQARSGTADAATPTAVQSASVTGASGPAPAGQNQGLTYLIQDRLVKLGYAESEPLKLDGKFGARTRALIEAYMSDHDLSGEPQPSRTLLRHMEESLRQARLRGNDGSQR